MLLFIFISFNMLHLQILYSDRRFTALEKTIELANTLRKMNNFEGMAAVTSVFGNAAVKRLKPLWQNLHSQVKMK